MNDAFILGYGVVGKATALALKIPHYFDKKKSNISLIKAAKKKYCFVCLPTDTDPTGSQKKSISVIRDYIKELQGYGGNLIYIIRSTVLPGTCRGLINTTEAVVVSNPEFLSEDTWKEDALKPRIKVIGSDDEAIKRGIVALWKPIRSKLEIVTDTVTAETIKYVLNTFAAVKGVYANQINDICEKTKADFETIHRVLHRHPWGSKEHLRVIDKGGRGIGGRCIPKDLKAFVKFSDSKLLQTVEQLNIKYLTESGKG